MAISALAVGGAEEDRAAGQRYFDRVMFRHTVAAPARATARAGGESTPGWAGAASTAPGLLAFTGAIGSAEPHAHAAVQVLLVLEGEVILTDRHGDQRRADAAIIPAGIRHELRAAPGTHGLLAYVDRAGVAVRAASARVVAEGDPAATTTWVGAVRPLIAAKASRLQPDPAGLPVLCSGLAENGASAAAPALPASLSRALQMIPQLMDGQLLLGEFAARVGVSASRLGHLFAEHLHLPYPAWRRWARLLHAIEAVRGGATLTEAAHGAGFADSAHLTRTFRAMFGLTPSQAMAATGRPASAR
ncbi:helix-turn-helix domain-containing protein [Nonomuraea sp. NPDC050153]|uniref:AraC family transcriptional regulator n=1 Tax=Nonomuraea sp. NPDC050153 TaxID=3364359 RepID=UPI0037A477AF